MDDSAVRLWIYRHFVEHGRAPSLDDIGNALHLTPADVTAALRRLAHDADALVLLPDSPYLWMAEPFSAVPTGYRVESGAQTWWGNCIWDALAILALVDADGRVEARCLQSATELLVSVVDGAPAPSDAIVHFLVPASDWWRSIGFT